MEEKYLFPQECINIKFLTGINNSKSLPNQGGLWVQPLNIPSRPKVSNKTSQGKTSLGKLGEITCTPKSSWEGWTNCRFFETNGWEIINLMKELLKLIT